MRAPQENADLVASLQPKGANARVTMRTSGAPWIAVVVSGPVGIFQLAQNSRIPKKSVKLPRCSIANLASTAEGLLTQQDPKAERSFLVVFNRREHWLGTAEMELFTVITRLAFGATMTFVGVTLLCEQLLYYLP